MKKVRQHNRFSLMADLTIQPGDEKPARFAGKVFNVSRGGLAVYSKYCFPPGKLTGIEIVLPVPREGIRCVTLYGVTRWAKIESDGNIVGIELVSDSKAGDYRWFLDHLDQFRRKPVARPAFTLIETCIAMVIICLLVTLATPSFRRAIEQARVDAASANLKTIWSAQRAYWLEYRCFSSQLSSLGSMDLIDSPIADSAKNPSAPYAYQILSADVQSFTARAMRNNSGIWTGQLQIDQGGKISGAISGPEYQTITPTQ